MEHSYLHAANEVGGKLGLYQSENTHIFTDTDPYVQFLLDNKAKTFYLKPWMGNTGDTLIWWGTENLLRDLHIRTTLNPLEADLVLIPGGNQTMWQNNIDIWKEVWAAYPDKEFAVGPMTAQPGLTTWVEDVRHAPVRIAGMFARDPESYGHLRECHFPGETVLGLSHDPALYLCHSDFIKAEREAASQQFVLAAFRIDHEGCRTTAQHMRRLSRLVPGRVLSRIDWCRKMRSQENKIARAAQVSGANGPFRVCDISGSPAPYFFEMLRAAREIHTDRLHCMLAAAMLEKPIFAYPTTFGKLEAVYEHSLKGWARVEFVGGL